MFQLRTKLCLILGLFFATQVSCDSNNPSVEKSIGDTLIIPEHQRLAPINPILTQTTISARLSEIIYDGLIRLDDRFDPILPEFSRLIP